MTAPKRIQRQRTKGWRMPDGAIYVGRPTIWGNPYSVGGPAQVEADWGESRGLQHEMEGSTGITPAQAVEAYEDCMLLRLGLPPYDEEDDYNLGWREALRGLAGKDLACWCPLDQPCHADVLLELANSGDA